MTLKYGDVNPLAVFGLRKVDHCPPHFSPIYFDLNSPVSEKEITDWIWENLEGRFFVGDCYQQGENGSVTQTKVAAFEEPGECSYFGLMLSTINQPAKVF